MITSGAELRERRKSVGETLDTLAVRSGVGRTRLWKYETRGGQLTADELARLEQALNAGVARARRIAETHSQAEAF